MTLHSDIFYKFYICDLTMAMLILAIKCCLVGGPLASNVQVLLGYNYRKDIQLFKDLLVISSDFLY